MGSEMCIRDSYQGFIKQCSEMPGKGEKVKPGALAEAHYNIAGVLAEKDPAAAVPHFQEARTMYPEQYASLVDLRLVQCFFKMKDAENLKKSLEVLERSNQSSYNALPPAILRWCGWTCFQKHDYLAANKYLSDALVREPREAYMKADGTQSERPKVEPIVDSENKVLGEVITPTTTIADTITPVVSVAEDRPVETLRGAISVVDRFMLIRDLFGDNEVLYEQTIDLLDKMDNLDDCIIYIAENFVWRPSSEGAKLIMDLLQRKFR